MNDEQNSPSSLRVSVVECQKTRILELEDAIKKTHAAKGRYHSQLAMCELYDLLGLPNIKPEPGKGNE